MTNAYFDDARPAQYTGGFRICHQCLYVVPSAYYDQHAERCDKIQQLLDHPAGLDIEDIDAEAGDAFRAEAEAAMQDAITKRDEAGGL